MMVFVCERVIAASVIAVFAAVMVDFAKYGDRGAVKKGRRSIVATGSMIGFFAVFCLVIYLRWGSIHFDDAMAMTMIIAGTSMVFAGAAMNIAGRLRLGGNWANHIRIYDGHTLVRRGIYKIVRHPLYASIMLMLFGGSVAYRNWLGAVLAACVFVPFMYYRAKQEERLLQEEFAEYGEYRKKTGMFFPKLWR